MPSAPILSTALSIRLATIAIFQKTLKADLLDDLMDRDNGVIIDLGNGKFRLADEIENARPLSDCELSRFSCE
jgi:hypothetical protein